MEMRKILGITLLLLSILGAAAFADGQGAPSPLGIVPSPSSGQLTVNIWMGKSTYAVGENARIFFSVSQPAFVYIYDIQPNGVVRLIFPNAYSQNNYVSAGTHSLPDGNYRMLVSPPTGVERLQIIASTVPLNLAPTSYSEPFPQVAPNPQAAGNTIKGHIMGITPSPNPCPPCPNWSTAWTSFTIVQSYSNQSYCPPPCPPVFPVPPCYGCAPGSWYWYNGQWYYGTPPSGSGWYWYYGPDGKWHFTIRIQIGGN